MELLTKEPLQCTAAVFYCIPRLLAPFSEFLYFYHMKLPIALAAFLLIVLSCKEKTKQPVTDKTAPAEKMISYLPIADLIRDDIRQVDSFAGGIVKKTEINGKKDSTYIKLEDFHRLITSFLPAELDTNTFHREFAETSLMDESTRLLNFIYTAKDTSLTLRKVIVYITPALTVDKVNMIYMEKEFMEGDVFVQQKLTWKTGQYCYILTIRQPKTGTPVTTMEKLIWDPQQFGG